MLIVYFIISIAVIIIDQLVKMWTVANFALGESMSVIPHLFSLTYLQNTGAAWSIFEGQMVFFTIITIIAVAVVCYLLVRFRRDSKFLEIGLSLILAGALGNFIDRLRLGYVVDMIQTDFINFPIFNVADSSLVIGVVLIFIYILFDEKMKGK